MLRLRARTDATARAKNGSPPQATTGVARRSSTHGRRTAPRACETGAPGIMSDMASANVTAASGSETQNRRVASTCSALGASSSEATLGSSAIPHRGHTPGVALTTSGCIGQTNVAPIGCGAGGALASVAGGRYLAVSCVNFFRHPSQQKTNARPSCSVRHRAVATSTFMPQTTSRSGDRSWGIS